MRKLTWLAAVAASVALVACSDKDPMSSMDNDGAVPAGKVVTSAPVAGTAENPLGLTKDGPTTFLVTIANSGAAPAYSASGVFNTPVGAAAPGPLPPGGVYSFTVTARAGDRLSFATMFVQSNDLFFAPGSQGIPVFSGGKAREREVTHLLRLWDAGTEVNQAPLCDWPTTASSIRARARAAC